MTRLIICLASILLPASAFSQSPKLSFQYGEPYELPHNIEDLVFIGDKTDGIINLAARKDDITLVRFDFTTLKKRQEQRLSLKGSKNYNNEKVVQFRNGNSFWINSDWDKKTDREFLYSNKINWANGELASESTAIIETSKISGNYQFPTIFGPSKVTDKYKIAMNASGTKIVVMHQYLPEVRDNTRSFGKFGFHVFDDNLRKIWNNDFVMPETEANITLQNLTIDGKGNVYLYVSGETAGRKRVLDVFRFTGESKEIQRMPLNVDNNDYFFRNVNIIESQGGGILLIGFYGNSTSVGDLGVFYGMPRNNGFDIIYSQFSKPAIRSYVNPKVKTKLEKEKDVTIRNLAIRDILLEADGGVFITSEEYYGQTNSRSIWESTYANIFAIKLKPDGEMDWMTKIPKFQWGPSPRGSMSFKFFKDQNGYSFLYVDKLQNIAITEDQEPNMRIESSDGRLVLAHISSSGVMTRQSLYETEREGVIPMPAEFVYLADNTLAGRCRMKKSLFAPMVIRMD